MADIVSPEVRSRMMSAIRDKNTKPEMTVRKGLHAFGYRYRLHVKTLPGNPDIVLRKHNAVILVQGCFWHAHRCPIFKWPSGDRQDWWRAKIEGNAERDRKNIQALGELGWRVLQVWECAMKGPGRLDPEILFDRILGWLNSERSSGEIRGKEQVG